LTLLWIKLAWPVFWIAWVIPAEFCNVLPLMLL
jgi:hypothetical protein